MYFKLANSTAIINTEGLRGVQPIMEEETMGPPYLEFRYDGGTTMQVGFKDDIELLSYLAALADKQLNVVEITNDMVDDYIDKRLG